MSRARILFFALASLLLTGCGGGGSVTSTPVFQPITIALSSNSDIAPVGNSSAKITVTVQRATGDTNPVTLSVNSPPSGVTSQITSPGAGSSGTIGFVAAGTSVPGTYSLTISATEGGPNATASLSLTVLSAPATVNVTVSPIINTSVGFGGKLQTFMTTTFQAAEWDQAFFTNLPSAASTLANLGSQHIRILTVSQGIPQKADQSWDFSALDATLDPVIAIGDKKIVLVLAAAPPWMNDSNGNLSPSHFQDFANYAAQMVKYYNTPTGFMDSNGIQHVHASSTSITYWGIFNEPDINGLSAAQYTNLYNATVTAMLGAGSTVPLKFVAVELAGTDPNIYLPTFIQNLTTQADILTGHSFAVCGANSADSDAFDAIPQNFVPYAQAFVNLAANSSNLKNAQIWLSDNNVDACFSTSPLQVDPRGSNSFFAAWRPYVFSQWAQAGSHMVAHWNFNQDPNLTQQFGEVTFSSGQPYLSYWVDFYLHQYFSYCGPDEPPTCSATGSSILTVASSEPSSSQTVEILATRNPDGSVVVMVADHAVNAANDVNGPGAPRTVVLDLSQLGMFASATELTIDTNTDAANGPDAASVMPQAHMTLNLAGYGVTFLKLVP